MYKRYQFLFFGEKKLTASRKVCHLSQIILRFFVVLYLSQSDSELWWLLLFPKWHKSSVSNFPPKISAVTLLYTGQEKLLVQHFLLRCYHQIYWVGNVIRFSFLPKPNYWQGVYVRLNSKHTSYQSKLIATHCRGRQFWKAVLGNGFCLVK